MKDCKKIHPLLSLYMEGELSAREMAAVEKHVSGCPLARAEVERLEKLRKTLRNLPGPRVPEDLHDKIMARLGRKAEPKVLWFKPAWALTAVAAALALILLVQYPRWSGGSKQDLALNKTAPSAPPPSKDNFGPSQAPSELDQEKAIANRPLVMALKKRSVKKMERPEISAAVASKAAREDKDQVVAGTVHSAEPTMVVAMAPPAPQAYAPAKAKISGLARSSEGGPASSQTFEAAPNEGPAVNLYAPAQKTVTLNSYMDHFGGKVSTNAAVTPQQPQTLWNGNFSPVTVESQELITDTATFQVEWNKVQPDQPLPPVDFTIQAVVLLNAGNQPTTGYSLQISRLEGTAAELIVHYRILAPAAGSVTGQMVTRPWLLQILPKPAQPVTFLKDQG